MPETYSRNIVITGATTGLGFQVAQDLLNDGHNVVVLAREGHSSGLALKTLQDAAKHGKCTVEFFNCDLSSFDSVRAAASVLLDEQRKWPNGLRRIHALVNNAGIYWPEKRHEGRDGYEMHIQVMWLSHVLLTELLVPLLSVKDTNKATGVSGRVIYISSMYHRKSKITTESTFDDPSRETYYDINHKVDGAWSALSANNDSKFAITATALQQAERYRNQIAFHSMHPGAYYTNIQSELPLWKRILIGICLRPGFSSLKEGGKLIMQFVLAPQWAMQTGLYFQSNLVPRAPDSRCLNQDLQERLYSYALRAVGLTSPHNTDDAPGTATTSVVLQLGETDNEAEVANV